MHVTGCNCRLLLYVDIGIPLHTLYQIFRAKMQLQVKKYVGLG